MVTTGAAAGAWFGYKPGSFALLELAAGDHVLDVGCGTGEDVRALAGLVRDVAVIGLDVSADKIREAQARSLGLPRPVEFRVGDACALPFDAGTFDACRADRVLHHLGDPAAALREMARVTRSGGRVVVSDVDYDTLVVAADDPAVTRRIVGHHADRMESGRVGRRLPGLLRAARLVGVATTAYAAVVTEYDEEVLQLRDKAERAVEAGIVPPEAAARWVVSLAEADRAGRFLCALTVFTVGGHRP